MVSMFPAVPNKILPLTMFVKAMLARQMLTKEPGRGRTSSAEERVEG